ncbi:hypothetical protein EN813_047485 [Mesorhizobium sp. M00.F.Ca.ET.170.01.1.1]|nr:hypothetical protein EN813_047485 [Mesorhizobium sp. M00.F.Ca.ET.170.01.1.1]
MTSTSELRWRDHGVGRGRELKRSFSNILGRFVARHYLEGREKLLDLVPIDGDQFKLGRLIVRRKTGHTGDLPDWIGCTASELVIGEAKGSHDRSNWALKAAPHVNKPAVIEKATAQVERVEIVPAAGPSASFAFKGWSVGSRWATKENGLDPWLMAVDPTQGEEPLPPDDFESARRAILNYSNFLMLRTMGFVTPSDSFGTDVRIEQFYSRDALFPVRLGTGEAMPVSLHAIAGPFGFLPIRDRRDFRFVRIARRFTGQVALISLSEDRLTGAITRSETQRRGGISIERNGVTLTLISRETDLDIAEQESP